MEQELIGRTAELGRLRKYLDSGKSEFVAVYGRRRVGKTFLIRNASEDSFAFFVTGVHEASKQEQLTNFAIALKEYSKSESLNVQKDWIMAFYELGKYLETLPEGRKIIFIDELPWMDTPKSGFIAALENFWNSWASVRNDIKLIVCGSATSWMINNLIRNRGGLHNRLTYHLVLEPFTLNECRQYFLAYGFSYTEKQIAECYMAMGGVPYYMSLMDKSLSLAQNMDALFFEKNAPLKNEFSYLYRALFRNPEPHIQIVNALSAKGIGMTRKELLGKTGLPDNGAFSEALDELELCGFIRSYFPFGRQDSFSGSRQSRDTLFQLMDFYTLFYYKFIKNNSFQDERFWTTSYNSPLHNAWAGLSFEMLCLSHVSQIKRSLGISGVQTIAGQWRSKSGSGSAQIDLLIDRKDETVNLCEMKYSSGEFAIDKEYEEKLRDKVRIFSEETKTRKSIILTMATVYGLKKNSHSGIVQKEIVLEDLFCE